MSYRPVSINHFVNRNLPNSRSLSKDPLKRLAEIRRIALLLGLHLQNVGYKIMEDVMGTFWAQRKDSVMPIVLPVGGRELVINGPRRLSVTRWLDAGRRYVIDAGQFPLDVKNHNNSFELSVQALYDSYTDSNVIAPKVLPRVRSKDRGILVNPPGCLKPVNPFFVARTWLAVWLGQFTVTQVQVSHISAQFWSMELNKHIFANIGKLYTVARNQGQPDLDLYEFTVAELTKYGLDTTPQRGLESLGYDLSELVRRPVDPSSTVTWIEPPKPIATSEYAPTRFFVSTDAPVHSKIPPTHEIATSQLFPDQDVASSQVFSAHSSGSFNAPDPSGATSILVPLYFIFEDNKPLVPTDNMVTNFAF